MSDFFFLLMVAVGGWLWWDSQKCKMTATQAAIAACKQSKLQFLDGTVHLRKAWLMRTRKYKVELCRLYFFEYSTDGNKRFTGRLVLVGDHILELELNAYLD